MTTRYTEDHEYIRMDGDVGTVGITHFAQDKLGDLVYVEQPKVGRKLAAKEDAAIIESVKAAAEVKSPVDGEVIRSERGRRRRSVAGQHRSRKAPAGSSKSR